MIRGHRSCTGFGLLLGGVLLGCGDGGGATNVVAGFGEIEMVSSAPGTVSRPPGEPVSYAPRYFAAAVYYRDTPGSVGCRDKTVAECTWLDCSDSATAPVALSGGLISISGGKRDLELVAGPDGAYPVATSETEALFDGGEQLTVKVAGAGDIPAHEASVLAPTTPTVTRPELADVVTVPRSQALGVSWAAQAADALVWMLTISAPSSSAGGISVRCDFPAGRGTGSIPAEVLALLPATPVGEALALSVQAVKLGGVSVGGWEVSVTLSAERRGLVALE